MQTAKHTLIGACLGCAAGAVVWVIGAQPATAAITTFVVSLGVSCAVARIEAAREFRVLMETRPVTHKGRICICRGAGVCAWCRAAAIKAIDPEKLRGGK